MSVPRPVDQIFRGSRVLWSAKDKIVGLAFLIRAPETSQHFIIVFLIGPQKRLKLLWLSFLLGPQKRFRNQNSMTGSFYWDPRNFCFFFSFSSYSCFSEKFSEQQFFKIVSRFYNKEKRNDKFWIAFSSQLLGPFTVCVLRQYKSYFKIKYTAVGGILQNLNGFVLLT